MQRDPHESADAHPSDERRWHQVVEDAIERRYVGQNPTDRRSFPNGRPVGRQYLDQASAPAALRRSAASASTCSHVNSGSERPKWP